MVTQEINSRGRDIINLCGPLPQSVFCPEALVVVIWQDINTTELQYSTTVPWHSPPDSGTRYSSLLLLRTRWPETAGGKESSMYEIEVNLNKQGLAAEMTEQNSTNTEKRQKLYALFRH